MDALPGYSPAVGRPAVTKTTMIITLAATLSGCAPNAPNAHPESISVSAQEAGPNGDPSGTDDRSARQQLGNMALGGR